MKNLLCPQCEIHRFQIKNQLGENRIVTVNDEWEIIPIHPYETLDGFDLTMLFCLGCSWSGSPESLRKGAHRH